MPLARPLRKCGLDLVALPSTSESLPPRGGGYCAAPVPELNVQFPDNLRDAKLLQSALRRAQTIDLPPPAPADANGEYSDLMGFSGEDTGLGTYTYLAFRLFGVNIPALTYLYFVIVTLSLLLYGIGHWRSVGAMAAAVAVTLALYVVVCDDIVNFLGSSELFSNAPGIDVKEPRFLGTIAAIPLLHVIVVWTRPRYRLGPLDYVVVALQAAIFAFALQTRSPVVWAVLALSAFWLTIAALALRRGRSLRSLCDWRQSRSARCRSPFSPFCSRRSCWPLQPCIRSIAHRAMCRGICSGRACCRLWRSIPSGLPNTALRWTTPRVTCCPRRRPASPS